MKPNESVANFLNTIDAKDEIFTEPVLSEETETVEEDDKPLPFHKDPKVQRYVEKEIAKALKDLPDHSEERKFRQEVQDEISLPPALIKLVGNDTPEKREALKELSSYLESLPQKAQEQFQEKMMEEQRQVAEKDDAALNELNQGFEDIEESFGVDLSSNTASAQRTRTAFVEYLRKVSHKNEDGEVDQFADIPAAWEEFQERNTKPSSSRARELASRGMTRSTDTSNTGPQGKSWKDVDRFFEGLKKSN